MKEKSTTQIELLEELLKWVRFSGMKQVKEVLTSTLNNDKKRIIAYHHSDGKNTSTVVAKLCGASQPIVSGWWREWATLGIGESITASGGGRFKRSFDLKMFGIQIPEIKNEQNTTEKEQQNQGEQQ